MKVPWRGAASLKAVTAPTTASRMSFDTGCYALAGMLVLTASAHTSTESNNVRPKIRCVPIFALLFIVHFVHSTEDVPALWCIRKHDTPAPVMGHTAACGCDDHALARSDAYRSSAPGTFQHDCRLPWQECFLSIRIISSSLRRVSLMNAGTRAGGGGNSSGCWRT